MTEFYTNVALSRGNILLRGIRDGKPFKDSFKYKPYHFVPTKDASEYQSTDGRNLRRMDFESINDAKQFIEKYDGVQNFDIFGFSKYQYNFINDTYGDFQPSTADLEAVSLVYTDIETAGNNYDMCHVIKIKHADSGKEQTITISEMHRYYEHGFEVFDEERNHWIDFDNSCYARSNGFPEADQAPNPITAIALLKGELKIVISTLDYTEHEKGVVHIRCRDEKELLFKFIDCWVKLNPDIITGWNIEFFDIPYIINRITDVLGESFAKQLSPWMQIQEYTASDMYGEKKSYRIIGVSVIDLQQAYKKFSFKNQESYSLNHVASVELNEKKIDYSTYDNLQDLYLKNPQLFIEYNLQDNDLVKKINKKTGLINQIMSIAYDAKINYADSFTSVLLWEVIIKNYLQKTQNKIVPTKVKRNHKNGKIMGAFVKAPRAGKYKWVIGLDLDSLYPHLIMQYNISPETFYKCWKEFRHIMDIDSILNGNLKTNLKIREVMEVHNCGYTPNGAFFKNDVRGFLPALMDTMYADRKSYKKLMTEYKIKNQANPSVQWEMMITQYHNMQMAKKICLNSAYGALSNEWFMWFDIDLAEAITYAGQLAIKWISKNLNEYLNKLLGTKDVDYVIANDTDSAYLTVEALVEKVMPNETDEKKIVEFLNKVCSEKINPFIEKSYEELREYTNGYEQKMSMKVESISEAGLWKAKKRYALSTWWDEGVFYDKPQLKIKGMEVVQSSTPALVKPSMKKCIEHILYDRKQEMIDEVTAFEEVFRKSPFESISYTTAISDLAKYADSQTVYSKGAQEWVRGALFYNKNIKEMGIDHKYQRINNGDKVKTCVLVMPNPINNNSMSIYNKLPKEFGLEKFIDYDTQFDKMFMKPMNELAKLVGWDLKNTATLDSFFS